MESWSAGPSREGCMSGWGELPIGFVACLICWVLAFVVFGTKGHNIMILMNIVSFCI